MWRHHLLSSKSIALNYDSDNHQAVPSQGEAQASVNNMYVASKKISIPAGYATIGALGTVIMERYDVIATTQNGDKVSHEVKKSSGISALAFIDEVKG